MTYKTGLEDCYVIKNNKKMRLGYTTGSCAAAAASGAAQILLGGKTITEVSLMTPKGILLHLKLEDITVKDNMVSCGVRKDAGDDPDTTDGILVVASVEKMSGPQSVRIQIDGGQGVGRVTKPGLACKPGEAAINPVPRSMIMRAVEEAADQYGYEGSLKVTISVPKGQETAHRDL